MKQIDKKKLLEWLKEGARWVGLFIFAWFAGETLKQVNLVPEKYDLHVWVFTYSLPIRAMFVLGLTVVSRFVDKLLHAKDIQTPLDLKWVK